VFDVLIITYKAGATGLNLQRATYMTMVDQPVFQSVYDQAVGRIARFGQVARSITVHRFFANHTMEQCIPHMLPTDFAWRDIFFA